MKRFAFAVAALALALGSALAADLPSRKEPILPPPPPPPMWTGFYVGLNAGGTWANSTTTTVASTPAFISSAATPLGRTYGPAAALATSGVLGSGNGGGFIGGGQIGYNWQFYDNFVAGVEADIQGVAGGSQSAQSALIVDRAPFGGGAVAPGTNFVSGATSVSRSLDYIGTVRGRLGWLFTPTLLLYGTGGLAYGGVSSNFAAAGSEIPKTGSTGFVALGAFSDTRVGWTAGGGVEWMFMPNWSAKVEYLYYDLGTVSYNATPSAAIITDKGVINFINPNQVSTRFNGNIVRAGVNYHFNWGTAPVVAKY